jgi:hypothetical protein
MIISLDMNTKIKLLNTNYGKNNTMILLLIQN